MDARLLSTLVLATLLVPVASAEQGEIQAGTASYSQGATQGGALSALFIRDDASNPQARSLWSIEVTAAHLEAALVESSQVLGPTVFGITQPLPDPQAPESRAREQSLTPAEVRSIGLQPEVEVHVQAVEEGESLAFEASSDAGLYEPIDSLTMGAGGMGEGSGTPNRNPASAAFWTTNFPGNHVLHDDQASRFSTTIRGDMVIEVVGATFQATDGTQTVTLESGVFEEPYAPTGLPSDGLLLRQRNVLLRLFLQDAELTLAVQGGAPVIYWASPQVDAVQVGETVVEQARGRLRNGDDVVDLQGERYVLPPETALSLSPQADSLDVAVAPAQLQDAGANTAAFVASDVNRATALAAVASLAIALALGLLWRRSSRPALADVEAAIEAQQFARGARLAKRILARSPLQEDALLGRAIALSKGGRAALAIREVRAFLARKPASDGSLHYVLGLALLDSGQRADAEKALADAVRLTPALAADVVHRLGQKDQASPASPTEARAYA